jgi:MFS family permease
LPVPVLIGLAQSWWWIVAANVLLGVNQGFAWSMTVVMKVDLAGPRRRGLALGLNEAAGYLGLAATAFASGLLAATYAPRTVVWVGAAVIAAAGLILTAFVRDTAAHARLDQVSLPPNRTVLRSCSQAGLVNNLNDALAWGLAPLYLAAHGASVGQIGAVAAVYPVVWGAGQIATGWLSDSTGRKPLIVAGMLVQAGALALLVAGSGRFASAVAAAALLGLGTALVYPTLLAAVSDAAGRARVRAIGVYRFWRDIGFFLDALLAGLVADAASLNTAILTVAGLTAVSGLAVAATPFRSPPTERSSHASHRLSVRTPA